jgi:hypothetical protein
MRRRVFIGTVAKRAAYIAPAVLALKAAQTTYAGPSACGQTGSPCNTDVDCCGGFFCLQPNLMACTGQMNCTCQ